jgi:hypothetical protein
MDRHVEIELKLLRKSAEKARRMARQSKDAEHVAECLAIAEGFEKLANNLQRLAKAGQGNKKVG